MPDPVVTLARQLVSAGAALEGREATVACGALQHRLVVTGDAELAPVDHDPEAEAVVAAVGGAPPPCLEIVTALQRATPALLWSVLAGAAGAGSEASPAVRWLRLLPAELLRLHLVRRMHVEFAGAGQAARASASRLCLSLLNEGSLPSPASCTRFAMVQEFPRWDTGDQAWSDKELVLLARMFRTAHPPGRPQLSALPTDAVARTTLARYLSGLLDDHRVLTRRDLSAALAPTHPNVASLVRLLEGERLLEQVEGGHRTRPVDAGRRASAAGRRRQRIRRRAGRRRG